MKRYKVTLDIFMDESKKSALSANLENELKKLSVDAFGLNIKCMQNFNNKKGQLKAGKVFKIKNKKSMYNTISILRVGSVNICFLLTDHKEDPNRKTVLYGKYSEKDDSVAIYRFLYDREILNKISFNDQDSINSKNLDYISLGKLQYKEDLTKEELIRHIKESE